MFPIAIGLISLPVPGVLVALAVALLAFVGRSRALWMAAMTALVLHGIRFYYALEPLLPSGAGSGVAVLTLDERGVATAVRLDDGSPPGAAGATDPVRLPRRFEDAHGSGGRPTASRPPGR